MCTQIQVLLNENSRLRSDPFSSHLTHSRDHGSDIFASIKDLTDQNLSVNHSLDFNFRFSWFFSSLERRLKDVEAEVEFLKKQKTENEDSKNAKINHEMEIENKKLKSKICNLEVLLQHSNMQCSNMEKTFNDFKQTRDRRIENLSREEVKIAFFKLFELKYLC